MSLNDNLKDILGYGTTSKTNKDVQENVKTKLLTEELMKQIIVYNPYLGLRIISDQNIDAFFKGEFSDLYFSNLLVENNSVLHREIANNQDFDISSYKYKIKDENRILKTIFSPITIKSEESLIAEQLSVYRPIGNSVLKILKNHENMEDNYNDYQDEIISIDRDNRAFSDPVYVGIFFFDIMIRESIYLKIEWHMWLFYYYEFTKQICINFKEPEKYPLFYEFSNTYSYFLYLIIHNLTEWIELIIKDTKNVEQPLGSLECESFDSTTNSNIIQSSVKCLVQCIKEIIDSENDIPVREKESLTHKVFKIYFDLILYHKSEEPKKYGKLLLNCILMMSKDEKKVLIQYLNSYDTTKLIGRENVSKGRAVYQQLKKDILESIHSN